MVVLRNLSTSWFEASHFEFVDVEADVAVLVVVLVFVDENDCENDDDDDALPKMLFGFLDNPKIT